MNYEFIKNSYPETAALFYKYDPFIADSEIISYNTLSLFLEFYGMTLSLIPRPVKRSILWAGVIMYSFDTYILVVSYNGEWVEYDYTDNYDVDMIDYKEKDEAEGELINKALAVFEENIRYFKHYAE